LMIRFVRCCLLGGCILFNGSFSFQFSGRGCNPRVPPPTAQGTLSPVIPLAYGI
jgi:hypothetical protein